jgi:hypothetical protein
MLRVDDNNVPRNISGCTRKEVTGGEKKLLV